jgi:TonB family protein
MKERWTIASLALVFSPLASYAEGVGIPELGIQIADLPGGASKPEVIQRLDGYLAILRLGKATLTIARLEDPVSPGSGVRDARYRAAQQADFDEDLGPKPHGESTVVAGHDAWTGFSARRSGPNVTYTCVTYAIVDQHLYRLLAHATGGDSRPPDFDAAVRAMSELTFGPIDRSAATAGAASGLLKMPAFHPDNSLDWYPAAAKRRGEQGVVDLEFSIDSKGHARDLQETYAVSDTLGKSAQALLQSTAFRVRPNWEENGYQKLRFNIEVQFWMGEPGRPCPEYSPPRIPSAEAIVICGYILR